jgi:hypothetical protein
MNLQDATLVFFAESGSFPAVADLAKSARDRLLAGEPADYRVLDDLIGQVSDKGILRAMRQKYSPAAFDAILAPIMEEIGRSKPIRSNRPEWYPRPGEDPLTSRA